MIFFSLLSKDHSASTTTAQQSNQPAGSSNETEELELEIVDDDDNELSAAANHLIDSLSRRSPSSAVVEEYLVERHTTTATATTTDSSASSSRSSSRSNAVHGPQEIIRNMDRNSDEIDGGGLRQRRWTGAPATEVPSTDAAAANTENCANENSENGNIFEDIPVGSSTEAASSSPPMSRNQFVAPPQSNIRTTTNSRIIDEFRVKLKYLNDDLKLVKGSPDEAIGDFKKYIIHFIYFFLSY